MYIFGFSVGVKVVIQWSFFHRLQADGLRDDRIRDENLNSKIFLQCSVIAVDSGAEFLKLEME